MMTTKPLIEPTVLKVRDANQNRKMTLPVNPTDAQCAEALRMVCPGGWIDWRADGMYALIRDVNDEIQGYIGTD